MGHRHLVVHQHLFAQYVVHHLVRRRGALQFGKRAGRFGQSIFLHGKQFGVAQLVEHVVVGIALVVENVVPRPRQRIGQRAVQPVERLIAGVDFQRLGFGRRRTVGIGQLAEGRMVGAVAAHPLVRPAFELLGPLQGGIVLRRQFVAETAVVRQVAHPLRPHGRCGRRRGFGFGRRLVQIGQHPFLFDGVDAVDDPPFGRAYLENAVFQLQYFVGQRRTVGFAVVAQAPPQPLDRMAHRILALLQPGVLFQQRHVFAVALQSRDAGFDGRLRSTRTHGSEQKRPEQANIAQ